MPTSTQYRHDINNWSWAHISTNTTTAVKTGGGTLHQVTVNKSGATANTFTIYDSPDTSGNVIGVYDGTMAPTTLTYDLSLSVGLCVVTATGTAPDLTVTYL